MACEEISESLHESLRELWSVWLLAPLPRPQTPDPRPRPSSVLLPPSSFLLPPSSFLLPPPPHRRATPLYTHTHTHTHTHAHARTLTQNGTILGTLQM